MNNTNPKTDQLLVSLTRHAETAANQFNSHHPKAVDFFRNAGIDPGKIREHAAKLLTSGTLVGTLLLSAPGFPPILPPPAAHVALLTNAEREKFFAQELQAYLPREVSALPPEKEQQISELINQFWGIDARGNLQGEHINQTYGLIGAEQLLPRFPGDTAEQHDNHIDKGQTPGTGAWGYFANSKELLTPDLVQKEKYYVAVQTLYLPDWNSRLAYLRDWYKYRKVAVINPVNGKMEICDIADAGPSAYTGKHFGASPQVMADLGLNTGMQKGPVILFFVEDPKNTIPLGPASYNEQGVKRLAAR